MAAIFTLPPREGKIPLEKIIRIAHDTGVGVIVDLAWSLPPKEHFWMFTRDYDAEVIIVSGGKGLRGPQGSGLISAEKKSARPAGRWSPALRRRTPYEGK